MPDQPRQLHLTAFMRPISLHTGAWRYPGSYPDANFNFAHITQFAQKLEAAKFDAFFMADHLAVLNMPIEALKRSHTIFSFEPFTLLSALSAVTSKIGLAATASTTYDLPYHVARRFASLDHLSNGRAAWNIVTTGNPESSHNFGIDEHMAHSDRYKRAREFYDVVTGLWDSFADDAFTRDVRSGEYIDPKKMHRLCHDGDEFKVRGPLNIARPPQGWPVIVQAGQSEAGRQLAAETAEVVFCIPKDIEGAKVLYADIKGRVVKAGRKREDLKILPAAMIIVGEIQLRRCLLRWGVDVDALDPDGPLPEDLPETNASKTSREAIEQLATREGLTIRQLAQRYGGYSGLAFLGSPSDIADEMETWLREEASDGFTCVFPFLPRGLEEVTDRLIPELQRRGLFRQDYTGSTLREHFGLERPENRFFSRS
ncbi:uncharacterized protein N7477_006366 [Penicillium maclennaniae]|uniref:uncharacterized protein n=1 Tax=Penicillium maclennaniae TaxID=1343394 RepID=UPI0025401E6E|nr:uncharacterized protein N7477_006366 [Penicillium maclennaniae]KAJ5667796.1 hypothetical protein N7477_006366 [Penicillium maclennaniae]